MNVAQAMIVMCWLLCPMAFAQAQLPYRPPMERTIVTLSGSDSLVLEGNWVVIERDTFFANAVTLLGEDSTRLTVRKDKRSAYAIDQDSLTPREYVESYYVMMDAYANGLGHWSCWSVMSRIEGLETKDCVLWRTVDHCDHETLGLYGADVEFVYSFQISSSVWTKTEQELFLGNTFQVNSAGVFVPRAVCGRPSRMLPDPPQLPSRSLTGP